MGFDPGLRSTIDLVTEFFIPRIDDADDAERVWQATLTFTRDTHGWTGVTERRIFRLGYLHDGKHMEAQVGVPHPYGFETSWEHAPPREREPVVAILECEGGPFLVCTDNRGVVRGEPILVGGGEPYEIVYFDGYGPDD